MNKLNNLQTQISFKQNNKNIVIDLYQYYFNGGFHSIITEKITRLLISYFMIFLYNFLINCIDYNNILYLSSSTSQIPNSSNFSNSLNSSNSIHENKSIYDFIDMSAWISLNPYLLICFCIYCFYLIFLSLNMINIIKKNLKIREIYKKYLKINDYRIKFITWDNIVNSFISRLNTFNDILDSSNIDIYTVNNKICHQSNIIISVIRNGFVSLPKYSKFLEWNYIFCIIDPIIIAINNSSRASLNGNRNIDINLNDTDTLENIHRYDNKGIYKLYNEPLLNKEIEDIERNVESINVSTNPLITESDLPSPITQFDSVLYNTLTENIRGDGVEIDCSMINNINEYISKAHYRINLVFWINLICIPFTVIILGLYLIIKYGEQIYRNPGILFQRQINITTKWKLRYYNELPNLYGERLSRIENNLDKIINTYNSSVRMVIIRFLTFLVGSIFLIVLVLSFIAPKEFSQLEIIPKHNVIWFLGVSGTLLLILNKLTNNSVSKSKLTKTEQITAFYALREDLITIHPQLQKIEDREYLVSLIHDIYKPRIVNMMYEILNLLLSPYYLWKWRKEVSQNASMILGLMENHYILGNVCSHSIFTNHNELINNPHMLISLKEFKLNHNWTIPSVLQINSNLTNSALLQTLIR
jgi:hypothetical protein